ncbi:WUSCHEL-related homeobox 11 [Carica papaya]|uniref:WUSCHEL-related homeobox 11 n=1 Tax=Carica papaya TaxID=3649 RepID=UPI000B8CF044|nr:WUSCHEL-related homeobox 11 [Carica papaya]
MEDQASAADSNSSSSHGSERSEPVRSRWTPKPEQILILESIFNSGMVNPPKDETVRIRKLLEKFGAVGDANVFYWFQNRRSRSRRRQRQLQASLAGDNQQKNLLQQQQQQQQQAQTSSGAIQYHENSGCGVGFGSSSFGSSSSSSSPFLVSGSSSCGVIGDDGVESLFSMSGQMGFQEIEQSVCPSDSSNLHYQPGFITVFINGVPTEVPRGPLDMKAIFGEGFVLVHSSGVPLPVNEFGFLFHSLQHGENYFLVIF